MTYPGHTNNPKGRPAGSRNRRTTEALDLLDERGDRDPIDIASEFANNANLIPEQRAPCVKLVADYKHSKMGATITRAYLSEPIEPPFVPAKSFHEINQNKAHLDGLWNSGRLDLASYNRACVSQQEYANNLEAECKLAAQGEGPQEIHITGGLPDLPGTAVIMPGDAPPLNGHSNGHVIDHQDAPALNGRVMRDPTIPLSFRVAAAAALLQIEGAQPRRKGRKLVELPSVVIRIPPLPSAACLRAEERQRVRLTLIKGHG